MKDAKWYQDHVAKLQDENAYLNDMLENAHNRAWSLETKNNKYKSALDEITRIILEPAYIYSQSVRMQTIALKATNDTGTD